MGWGITTSALSKATGLSIHRASNVLSNLCRSKYLIADDSRKKSRAVTWVLTQKGRDKVERLWGARSGSGQRKKATVYKNAMQRDVMLKLAVNGVTTRQLSDACKSSVQKANQYLQVQCKAGLIEKIGMTAQTTRGAVIYGITLQGEYVMKGGVL